jgi:hypothetical protein
MPDIPCEERTRLERAVIVAIQGLYAAESTARGPVRIVERDAVKALQDHIELHGCRGSHGVFKVKVGLRSPLHAGRPRSSESTRFLR